MLHALLAQAATAPDATDVLTSIDWERALLGVYPLTLWLIQEVYHLRKENAKLNQESRDMAKSSVEALVRMASERKP